MSQCGLNRARRSGAVRRAVKETCQAAPNVLYTTTRCAIQHASNTRRTAKGGAFGRQGYALGALQRVRPRHCREMGIHLQPWVAIEVRGSVRKQKEKKEKKRKREKGSIANEGWDRVGGQPVVSSC